VFKKRDRRSADEGRRSSDREHEERFNDLQRGFEKLAQETADLKEKVSQWYAESRQRKKGK
jgi:hypothetical protein